MMLSPRLSECKECADILPLIEQIDCKITELAKCAYNKIIYAMNTSCDADKFSSLLHYKRILLSRFHNPEYADSIQLCLITSRVKILVAGAECDCIKEITTFELTSTTTTTSTTLIPSSTTTTTTTTNL